LMLVRREKSGNESDGGCVWVSDSGH
jgi:hypothetical protein